MRSSGFASFFRTVYFCAVALFASGLGFAAAARAQLSTNAQFPGSVVSDAGFGSSVWIIPGNAAASDNVWAQVAPGGTPTQYLKATNFNFNIPGPAQIVGIEAVIDRHCASGTIQDARVRIVKGGVVGATDRAIAGTWPTGSDATATYGGSSDLWGDTWTPADINASGFGVALSVTDSADLALVDYITLKVYYSLCAAAPAGGCRTALKSIFIVKDKTPDSKDKMIWKWIKGMSTSTAEFEDPISTATYALCVYAGGSTLIADMVVPPGGPNWTNISTKGFKYLDSNAAESGIQKVILKANLDDRAKALVKGKGDDLPPITPPLALPVTVQLINSDSGVCWEGIYDVPDLKKNETGSFKAKAQ